MATVHRLRISAPPSTSNYSLDVWAQQLTNAINTLSLDFTDLTYSGLTTGQVLRATGATSAAFGALDLANASAVTGLLPWANVNKTGSSLADLATRSAGDLSSGNLAYARLPSGGGTWANGGALAFTGGSITAPGFVGPLTGNADTATKLATARTIWGQSFDGSANVSGAFSSATTGNFSGSVTVASAGAGALTVGDGTTAGTIAAVLNGPAGSAKDLQWSVGGLTRFILRVTGAETGSNAGSDFTFSARSDAGAFIDSPLTIVRAAGGLVTLARPVRITGDLTFTDATYDIGKSGATRPRDGFFSRDVTIGGKFGCNGATAQAAAASGGALAAYATGAFGLDSDAHMSAMHALVVAMRAALVANGIMS